jgi:hypothetical protein
MDFHAANDAFEAWLRRKCAVVPDDVARKHRRMRRNPFLFLRATFFRWAGTIETVCPELAGAPPVLAVGDAHLENFGTWRDGEGRLVWGINDFDDASVMPYPFDLVRLAASVRLAPGRRLGRRAAARAILRGYRRGLAAPRPTLLDEQETWMRPLVACTDADRAAFWRHVADLPAARLPAAALKALAASLPPDAGDPTFARRVAGGGSLGRPRFVAVAAWRGGRIVREAKALVPSAWDWAHGHGSAPSRFMALATGPSRAPDPGLAQRGRFIVRRLAADSRKVELGDRPGAGLEVRLLRAMGGELGALHAADRDRVAAVRADLAHRDADWLHVAAKRAAEAVLDDYQAWTARPALAPPLD